MTRTLSIHVRQTTRAISRRYLSRLARTVLEQHLRRTEFDLGIYVVGSAEMTRLNQTFLQHEGSTDVITFDYGDPASPALLQGEIFICVDEALLQSKRFRTSWQSEVVRYVVHGVLHLCGYDDRTPPARQRMKRQENRLVRELSRSFPLRQL